MIDVPLNDAEFERALVGALPHLTAFAVSLCGCRERAKDIVQETLLRGWKSRADFRASCEIRPWLFKILRNVHISAWRSSSKAVTESIDDMDDASLKASTRAVGTGFVEVEDALAQLSNDQREVLLLIVAEGLTYEEVATICGCPVGTIRSRLSRARERLSGLLRTDNILLPRSDDSGSRRVQQKAPVHLPKKAEPSIRRVPEAVPI